VAYAVFGEDRLTVAIWATIWATYDTARLVAATRDGPADRGTGALHAMAGLARCSGSPADAARCTAFLFVRTYLSESAVDLCRGDALDASFGFSKNSLRKRRLLMVTTALDTDASTRTLTMYGGRDAVEA